MLLAATIALSCLPAIQNGQPPALSPQETVVATYKMAGQDVPAAIPTPTPPPLPGVSWIPWNGWNYLVSDKGTLLGRAKGLGGWADVLALYSEAKAKFTDATPQWRVKAVVFTRLDGLDASQEGVLRQRRVTLEQSMVDRSLRSLARFCVVAEAFGGGRFKVVPDVEIENDPIHADPSRPTFDEHFIEWYFGPRINGGEFDAPDKVYRGPYDSVLFIHPGSPGDGQPTALVAGTPVTGIAYDPKEDGSPSGDLTDEELAAWLGHMEKAAAKWGIPSDRKLSEDGIGDQVFEGFPEQLLIGPVWAKVPGRAAPSVDDTVAVLARQGKPTPVPWADVADDPWRKLPWLQPADAAKFTGNAALVDVGVEGKFHSFAFTSAADQAPPKRTDVPPVSLDSDIVIGRESLALLPNGERGLLLVPGDLAAFVGDRLKPDFGAKAIGAIAWGGERFVVFDLKVPGEVKTETDLLDLTGFAPQTHGEGPDHYPGMTWTLHYGKPAVYTLPAGTQPDTASDKPEARALAAARLSEESGAAQRSAVVSMLTSREDFLKLNAAQAFTRVKEPAAEAPLTDIVGTYNTRLAAVALRALAFQGTDTAWVTIRRIMDYGRYDYCRQVATELIATRNDPKDSAAISIMITARSWQARMAGALAIGSQKDIQSQSILMAFLNEVDPAVRLAVVKSANPALERIAHDLLWPAVNDPSEEVRAWSCIGLIRSTKEEDRQEGYKGVRDDSVAVRLLVLDELQTHPNAAHRGALRLAAADSNSAVRAAALQAFAKQPGDVAADEISAALADRDPRVQKALVALAKAKAMKLPAATLAMLRSSADPTVALEAKELPE